MEDFQYEMINLFNNNFKCNDFKNILKLYQKDISLKEYFKNVKLKQEIYQHPLFKNYNYCLFCNQREKTKYNSIDLINSHIELKEKNIGEYLLNNNIKLREIKYKKEKIAKRRFINSYDNLNKKKNGNNLDLIIENESDTELYICGKKIKNNKISQIYTKKLTYIDRTQLFKKSYSTENKNNDNKRIKTMKYNYDKNNFFKPIKHINLINQSSERKINIDEEYEMNSDTLTINLEKEDIKIDFNNIGNNFNKYNSDNQEDTNIIKKKDTYKTNIITLKKEKDKVSNKSNSNKIIEIFEETKKFLGLGKKNSHNRDKYFRNRTISNNIEKYFIIKNKLKNFSLKNDSCKICLQEIREKFTLTCGDFFCRGCIRDMILTGIKQISNLDTLHCPTCNERLLENTIKKLLSEEEFQKYQFLMTKINGLKNKDHIPCPYPDCPGWAEDNHNHENILDCQYNHSFCKKCLKIRTSEEIIQNIKHKCCKNMTEEESKTMEFFKQNKSFRKCPNCQSMVVREGGGCNNMTCTNIWCGYEFCWLCNKKYEESHYRNPLSLCFGLSEMNYNERLAKYSRDRFFRCFFIFLGLIFIILPVIIVFFSIFAVVLYIITFVLDGSAMKHIKLKSSFKHRFFYKIVYLFFFFIAIAYIPIGYASLAILVISTPFVCIFYKIRRKNEEELE